MPDRDDVVFKICWSTGDDLSPLTQVDEATLKSTIQKLTQPLAEYLIHCQLLEKDGLWQQVGPLGLWTPQNGYSPVSEKLQKCAELMLNVSSALDELPTNARAPLLAQFIPNLEKQIAQQFPEYRMLVYETKKAVQAQAVQKKENARKAKVDDWFFWVLELIFIAVVLIVEFRTGLMFNLDEFGTKFSAATGLDKTWLIVQIFLTVLTGFFIFAPLSLWLAGLRRKASDTMAGLEVVKQPARSEEQGWVWLCQRCEHLEPYLLEESLDCPRCGNGMTRVRGQWGR